MDVCATPAREPRKKLQLSPPLSHMVATLPFPRRDATMSVSVSLCPLSLSLSLSLYSFARAPSASNPRLMHSPALIREEGTHRGRSVSIARVKTWPVLRHHRRPFPLPASPRCHYRCLRLTPVVVPPLPGAVEDFFRPGRWKTVRHSRKCRALVRRSLSIGIGRKCDTSRC